MKKITLSVVIFFFLFNLTSIAQDIIYKADGSREEAKVTLVGEKEIQYKKFSNPDGPVYVMNKSDIVLITYENGEYEIIQPQRTGHETANTELSKNFTRNILNYHSFDVFYGDVTFSYERIIGSGIVGIQVPVGFGWAYDMDYFNNNDNWVKNLFFSGVGANFYPGGQGKWRYFVGPKILVGYGQQTYWVDIWDEQNNWMYSEEQSNEGMYMKYMVDNGIRFTPMKNFCVAAVLSVGIRYFPEVADYNNAVMPTGHFSINIGYRF
jgi:hypothetical protein